MRRDLPLAAFLALMIIGAVVWATTLHTITTDGDLSDFAPDEQTAGDPWGDSTYGANNDLGPLYATWDASRLYLGFEYRAWGAAVIYLLDTGAAGGVSDLCPNKGYSGAFKANVQGSFDVMLALWVPANGNKVTSVLSYRLANNGSAPITVQSAVKDVAATAKFVHNGKVELGLPWQVLYGLGAGKVPKGATVRVVGVIRGALDGDGLGDWSPDPVAGKPSKANCWGGANKVAKYHTLTIDDDGDGVPDKGWQPGPNVISPDAFVQLDAAVPDMGLGPGKPCGSPGQCASGYCVDSVCCGAACGGGSGADCQACSKAKGAAHDGVCGPVSKVRICRAAAGNCDVAEQCDGKALQCPADLRLKAGTVCRKLAGNCDVAEQCDGKAAACPADKVYAAGFVCRKSLGSCDAAEKCTGKSGACPSDSLQPIGSVCRKALGPCDTAEKCTGKTTCPVDTVKPSGIVCRKAAGVCDLAEQCTGTTVACPANKLMPDGTSCQGGAASCKQGKCVPNKPPLDSGPPPDQGLVDQGKADQGQADKGQADKDQADQGQPPDSSASPDRGNPAAEAGAPDQGGAADLQQEGCGCQLGSPVSGGWSGLGLLLLALLAGRRRRQ